MNTAQRVREYKEKHPEKFCTAKGCLWRTVTSTGRLTPCRKHNLLPRPDVVVAPIAELTAAGSGDSGVRARLESTSNNGQPAVNELTAGNRADRNYSGSDASKITDATEVTK